MGCDRRTDNHESDPFFNRIFMYGILKTSKPCKLKLYLCIGTCVFAGRYTHLDVRLFCVGLVLFFVIIVPACQMSNNKSPATSNIHHNSDQTTAKNQGPYSY